MRRGCQLEMDNKMLTEKLGVLHNQNKSDARDVIAMYCTQPLAVQSSTTSVVSRAGQTYKLLYTCIPVN